MLTQAEIERKQDFVKKECFIKLQRQLAEGAEFFHTLFPNATIRAVLGEGEKSARAKSYLAYRIEQMEKTLISILDAATATDPYEALQTVSISGLQLTAGMTHQLIHTLASIINCGRNLQEADLIFLGEIGAALDISSGQVLHIIDQVQYESRKSFFEMIQKRLNEDQQDLCAILLLKAIRADERVHPAEFKYFENLSQLLNHDQARLEHVGISAETFDFGTAVTVPRDIATYIFQYLVEIVMCDRQYDPRESRFIQDVAQIFRFDKQQQDTIIQPVASALMTKADLFQ